MTIDFDIPWVERYRPASFLDIVSQSMAINNLKEFVEIGDAMPHMIFTGPAGTGKTSTALIIAKYIFKGDDYSQNVLELNASDTVRMDYVRTVIKNFTNQNLTLSENNIKLVILDEADNIPTEVQQALRRIIEKTSTRVKFILMCNYINRIIDPIISRCAVFRFVGLSEEKIIERLRFITEQEKISLPDDKKELFFQTLFFISGGDLRKAINTLQMSVALELIDNLEIDEVLKISGFLDLKSLKQIIEATKKGGLIEIRDIFYSMENFDSRNFLRQLLEQIPELHLDNKSLVLFHAYMGDIDYRISQGADEKTQILALLARLVELVMKSSK